MEAQGAGMQVLTTARLAVAMGLPIYGIIALASTATDRQGRSVPAPGQGILTTAREVSHARGGLPPTRLALPAAPHELQVLDVLRAVDVAAVVALAAVRGAQLDLVPLEERFLHCDRRRLRVRPWRCSVARMKPGRIRL